MNKTPRVSRAIPPGTQIGLWTVLSLTNKKRGGKRVYLCRCICGTEKEVVSKFLNQGLSQSCGCLVRNPSMKTMLRRGYNEQKLIHKLPKERRKDIIENDHVFGYLKVTEYLGTDWKDRLKYACICQCSEEIIVTGDDLLASRVKSCPECKELAENPVAKVRLEIPHGYPESVRQTAISIFSHSGRLATQRYLEMCAR